MVEKPINSGLAWPMHVDERGSLAGAHGEQAIRLSLLAILGTHPGERLMRPTFGCPLRSLVFAPNNAATANLARFYVIDALTRWEPRIVLEVVQVTNEEKTQGPTLLIEVSYRIRGASRGDRLTFQMPLT